VHRAGGIASEDRASNAAGLQEENGAVNGVAINTAKSAAVASTSGWRRPDRRRLTTPD
jgi:hypothetical protein